MGNRYNRYMRLLDKIGLSYSDAQESDKLYDLKQQKIHEHIAYMLNRTHRIFRYENLPESIPERTLELYLQCNGFCIIYKHDGKLYPFFGGLGGQLNEYYMPTIATIANPYLNLSVNAKIDENCIVIPNDTNYMGLLPLYSRYAEMLTEAEMSLNVAQINSRIQAFISAPDDATKVSAEKYLEDVRNGKQGIVAENAFLDGIRVQPYGNMSANGVIKNVIESIQYIKASWYNEIGINANFNLKREALNSAESALNDDALVPLIDDMYECRKQGIEKVNQMFGTNISVSYGSVWDENKEEREASLENMKQGGETDGENETDRDVSEMVETSGTTE